MEENNALSLIFVKPVGTDINGFFEYDFIFSETPDVAWAEDWAEQCPSVCEFVEPENKYINLVRKLKTTIPLFCIQNNSCFSMQDSIDGIVSLCFEDISEYESYPEPYRLIFNFGENIKSVEEKLEGREELWYE